MNDLHYLALHFEAIIILQQKTSEYHCTNKEKLVLSGWVFLKKVACAANLKFVALFSKRENTLNKYLNKYITILTVGRGGEAIGFKFQKFGQIWNFSGSNKEIFMQNQNFLASDRKNLGKSRKFRGLTKIKKGFR